MAKYTAPAGLRSPLGFDRWDLLYPLAPKPLLILVSAHDFFGTYSPRYLANGREEFEKLAKVYSALGHRDHLDWKHTPLPHGLTYALRLDTYNWFERWLKDSSTRIEQEPHAAPEAAETLWTGPVGNVIRDYNSRKPFHLVQDQARKTTPSGAALDFDPPDRELRFSKLTQTPTEGAHIEAVEVQSGPHVWIPAWIVACTKADPSRPVLLLLDDRGRNSEIGEGGLYQRLSQSGALICAADLRGVGDMRPEVGRGNPGYTIEHDTEEDFAWGSLILGKSLLRQRAEDILALTQALKNDARTANRRIVIGARGRLTIPALLGFAASPLADSLYLAGGLVSYANLLETEEYRQPLSIFEWDIFRKTDLPQLAEKAARPISLAGVVDARGNTMDANALRRIYPSNNIRFSPQAAWDQDVFENV